MVDAELIDRMQEIRRLNNFNWLDLMKLAVQTDPLGVQNIYSEIDGEEAVDRMKISRAENNRRLMDLVRLVVRLKPKESKDIIWEISKCDAQIVKILQEIAYQ